jgi:hypothetical protein
LERIEESAFQWSGLKSIKIPSSVIALGEMSFYKCKSLKSVEFESGCQLKGIGEEAFYESGLRSIEIPSSVVTLGRRSFSESKQLASVKFERGSKMERIDESLFSGSGVNIEFVRQELHRKKSGTVESGPNLGRSALNRSLISSGDPTAEELL